MSVCSDDIHGLVRRVKHTIKFAVSLVAQVVREFAYTFWQCQRREQLSHGGIVR